jgi:chemotaxis protein methyltransferase CheR
MTLLPLSAEDSEIRALTAKEYEQIRRLAYQQFGLNLQENKQQLVAARLTKQIRALGLRSFEEYYRHVTEDRTGKSLEAMIDALTTNHTSFFREPAHFDFFKSVLLPQIQNRKQIAVWSAACSTGEEPFSIALTLLDTLGETSGAKIRILATDISTRVLAQAERGAYQAARFGNLSHAYLRRYVLKGEGRWKDWFLMKKEVRSLIEFRRLNLMESFPHNGIFPVIFCRNVMIYFDRQKQQEVVGRLAQAIEPGGYLFVGHSESLNSIQHPLQYVAPAIYRKAGSLTNQTGNKR